MSLAGGAFAAGLAPCLEGGGYLPLTGFMFVAEELGFEGAAFLGGIINYI